jgi:hypothetical protein
VIAALLSAGATEEIIADAQQILVACNTCIGRPGKYKDRAERDRAYRERKKKVRDESRPMVSSSDKIPLMRNKFLLHATRASAGRANTRIGRSASARIVSGRRRCVTKVGWFHRLTKFR